MARLLDFIKQNRLFLDGAMGSSLITMGLDTNLAEYYNISLPSVVSDIHKSYLEVGSKLIYTNTFGANSHKYPDTDTQKHIITKGIDIAMRAARPYNAYVGYDVGSIGRVLTPIGDMTVEECYNYYREQAKIIREYDIDAVILETMTDTLELKQAILAFKEHTNFPIFASMTFNSNARTFNGSKLESFAIIAEGLGVDVVGINCTLGAKDMLSLAERLSKATSLPIFIKPNAGMPRLENGKTIYDTNAEEFSNQCVLIAKLGIGILGGCCGTNAEYISKLITKTAQLPIQIFSNRLDAVCSGSQIVDFKEFRVIGERLNPTGKPLLKEALRAKDYNYIIGMAKEQLAANADILDINVGMPGIDEVEMLAQVVSKVSSMVALPIQIDSVNIVALEKALRIVDGIPIINSVSGDIQSIDTVLPLVKKYGAYVVALCLDENGVPNTAVGRQEIAKFVINKAKLLGIPSYRILVDPLVMAVSVDTNNAKITLDTLELVKQLSVKTTLGLSNVSFGLPERDVLNATFYHILKTKGLDTAIVNPALAAEDNILARNVLEDNDSNCREYIANIRGKTREEISNINIESCIVDGYTDKALGLIKSLATVENYQNIINSDIIEALNKLGAYYESGRLFLPQLISGAECAKIMLDYLRATFSGGSLATGETIILATVKGDCHDIGKNIVKAVLSNYGYNIIDLGKDVSSKAILEAIEVYNANIVGLSALMTTTLVNMKDTVADILEKFPDVTICVGGAVVTAAYASSIHAHIYGENAQSTANLLQQKFNKI